MKKKIIIVVVLLISIFSCVYFTVNAETEDDVVLEPIEKKEEKKEKKKIYVDLKGAVINPGVYECEENMTVMKLIEKAGGLRADASTEYINLSKRLKDEMVVIIYTQAEIAEQKEGDTSVKVIDQTCVCPKLENDVCIEKENTITNEKESNENKQEEKQVTFPISLNQSSLEELMALPGIGEKKAQDIISYRESHNGFQTVEELKEVKGIGEASYEKIEPYITL